jgi:RND family efflux transporter MFP subunit
MKKVLFIALVGTIIISSGCSRKNNKTTELEKKPIEVKVVEVQKGELARYLHYKGTVEPWKRANIQPDVSGRISKIYRIQGDRVKKGTLLAELDTTTLKLQLQQVQAAFAVAVASQKDAQLNFERISKLYEKRAVSKMQFEKTQLLLEAADTQKKSAEANLNVIRHTLENSYMKAPFNGIITAKHLEEGDMINPMMGMTPGVLTLMDLSKVKIILDVPAEDIEVIKRDQHCHIRVYSLPGQSFDGEVYSKNLAADPVSKTFKVEVKVENPNIDIKAGVFAEVDIEILKKEDVLMIPNAALIDDIHVMVYREGKAKKVALELGERNSTRCEVISGLQAGDRVIVEGNYDLKEGSLVSIAGEKQ